MNDCGQRKTMSKEAMSNLKRQVNKILNAEIDHCRKGLPGSGGHADLLAIKPAGFLHSLQNKVSEAIQPG